MKILLDIEDHLAERYLETLGNDPNIKATKLTDNKAELLSDIRKSVLEMNQVLEGKLEALDAEEMVNEL